MFEDRSYKRTFYSAPQSVTSLVAAVLEPTLIVLVYLATALWFREPIMRPGPLSSSSIARALPMARGSSVSTPPPPICPKLR